MRIAPDDFEDIKQIATSLRTVMDKELKKHDFLKSMSALISVSAFCILDQCTCAEEAQTYREVLISTFDRNIPRFKKD